MNLKATRFIALFVLTGTILGSSTSWAYAKPVQKNRQYYEERGEIVWEVPTQDKLIALTFDDGPDPVQTPQILALLKQYHAKGTFLYSANGQRNFLTSSCRSNVKDMRSQIIHLHTRMRFVQQQRTST